MTTSSFATLFSALLLPVALPLAPLYAQGGCDLLAKDGLVETSSTLSDREIATSYRRWFCDKRFAEKSETESYSIKGLAPLKGIPVQLGFDHDRDDWAMWSAQICSDERKDMWEHDIFVQSMRRLNVDLANVIKACIAENRGLNVWLERTSDTKFKVALHFVSPVPKLRSARVTIKLDKDLHCDPPLTFKLESPGERRLLCNRVSASDGSFSREAAQLVVNSNDIIPQGGGDLVLPAIYSPPPLLPCTDEDRKGYTASILTSGSAVSGLPGLYAVVSPRSANPPTLYFLAITADGHAFPKCQDQKTLAFTQADSCRFFFRGRQWSATLGAVQEEGKAADVRFAPECP